MLVTQTIVDGFQRGWFSLMLAVDFSAAFDRAWRARLLQKMLDRGWSEARMRKVMGGNFLRCFQALRPG